MEKTPTQLRMAARSDHDACDEIGCQECCDHFDVDHYECQDCGKQFCPGEAIDRAQDSQEDR